MNSQTLLVLSRIALVLALASLWPEASHGAQQAARGDANNDGVITLADAIYVSQYLFAKGPQPAPTLDSGDANCDARIDPLDVVAIINFVVRSGSRPGCPSN